MYLQLPVLCGIYNNGSRKCNLCNEVKDRFKKKLVRIRLKWIGHVGRTGDKNIDKEIRCPESGGKKETESDGKVCNKRYLEKVGEEWRTAAAAT